MIIFLLFESVICACAPPHNITPAFRKCIKLGDRQNWGPTATVVTVVGLIRARRTGRVGEWKPKEKGIQRKAITRTHEPTRIQPASPTELKIRRRRKASAAHSVTAASEGSGEDVMISTVGTADIPSKGLRQGTRYRLANDVRFAGVVIMGTNTVGTYLVLSG